MSDQPTTIVIFGASGDLTQRKLMPSLFNVFRKRQLPENFYITGFSNTGWTDDQFREAMRAAVDRFAGYEFNQDEWQGFASRLFYTAGGFTAPEDFATLRTKLKSIENGLANRLYYLATPPRFFADITNELARAGMVAEDEGWRRVVVEKPFGTDLASAVELNNALHKVLREGQIYRIDHYLGKETVQNVLVFRFANTIFEPVWNRNYIDHVQITVAENVGVGHRAGYYDKAGVVRDMFQNHLMQLLCIVAMEPPISFTADAVRDEKVKVLHAVRPITGEAIAENVVRAQYAGYGQEEGVAPDSQTPTYAAMRLHIDNWRWQDVPFFLRSGKKMARKATEVIVQFKCPPHLMFPLPPGTKLTSNYLALCIQPDEGVHLRFEVKVPDTEADMRSMDMDFHYDDSFGISALPEAYERLLLETLQGDASLFTRHDQIEVAWALMDPILASFAEGNPPLRTYDPGSWGPPEADELLARNGYEWIRGCAEHGIKVDPFY